MKIKKNPEVKHCLTGEVMPTRQPHRTRTRGERARPPAPGTTKGWVRCAGETGRPARGQRQGGMGTARCRVLFWTPERLQTAKVGGPGRSPPYNK